MQHAVNSKLYPWSTQQDLIAIGNMKQNLMSRVFTALRYAHLELFVQTEHKEIMAAWGLLTDVGGKLGKNRTCSEISTKSHRVKLQMLH